MRAGACEHGAAADIEISTGALSILQMSDPKPSKRDALLAVFYDSLCGTGLFLGTLCVAASLTPTLVPRSPMMQGALSGLCFAAGYALGVLLRWIWRTLGWPQIQGRSLRLALTAMLPCCAVAIAGALWWAGTWQNRLRALMHMPPIDSAGLLTIFVVALVVFGLLLMLARLFQRLRRALSHRLKRRIPAPTAAVLASLIAVLVFWMLGNGVLVRAGLRMFDSMYSELDARMEVDLPPPRNTLQTGGPGSLLRWQTLGRQGRRMIADGPDRAQIESVTGHEAREPLRVYVGLGSADTPQARAQLALAELKRIGAFERANLVIATPTGTGWVDEESQHALEYLLLGDVATVSVQYSYFASWLALLTQPDYGVETARAVFAAVYGHWRSLPRDARPRLYLHGLSLGALNSDLSHDLAQVISDPYQGALWSGPPFNTPTWRKATKARDAGTPAWLPRVDDGAVMRFTSQQNHLHDVNTPWGGYRIVFLQYASDAVTFFDPGSLWHRPEWMQAPLGPDVSPDMVWIPVVSFLQLSFDLMVAVSPPKGFGHVYAFEHYVDAWAALTGPSPWWNGQRIEALKERVARKRAP